MAEWVRALDWRPGGPGFESRCGNFALEFGNSVYPTFPVSFGGDTNSRRSLLSGVYARGSKRSHQSALFEYFTVSEGYVTQFKSSFCQYSIVILKQHGISYTFY